jgi:hypothetical protein
MQKIRAKIFYICTFLIAFAKLYEGSPVVEVERNERF